MSNLVENEDKISKEEFEKLMQSARVEILKNPADNSKTVTYHFPDSWAAAFRQFFKELGSLALWAMFLITLLHIFGSLDIVELIHGK